MPSLKYILDLSSASCLEYIIYLLNVLTLEFYVPNWAMYTRCSSFSNHSLYSLLGFVQFVLNSCSCSGEPLWSCFPSLHFSLLMFSPLLYFLHWAHLNSLGCVTSSQVSCGTFRVYCWFTKEHSPLKAVLVLTVASIPF